MHHNIILQYLFIYLFSTEEISTRMGLTVFTIVKVAGQHGYNWGGELRSEDASLEAIFFELYSAGCSIMGTVW